jgi:GNAT superfamily N-acetyltransferase
LLDIATRKRNWQSRNKQGGKGRNMAAQSGISIRPVVSAADRKAFVYLPYRLYANDPHWVPPFKSDVHELINPAKNPFFGHADVELFLAEREGRVVGRISAHIDHLALAQPLEQGMGPGTGNWGLFEAEDANVAAALIARAEDALRARGMHRVLGPISMSVWEEPGLLTKGFDHPPTFMMGHHSAAYAPWIAASGYAPAKELFCYEIPIDQDFPPLVQRIVSSGERNGRIVIRHVDKSRFDEEAALIIGILNDAWSNNWGFVPFTPEEIAYASKKLKPIVYEDLIRVAEVDGQAVAFMMTLPDMNERLIGYGGSLWPFNWAKLLWWLRAPKVRTMRVPLMGVLKSHQGTRLASQLAFMLIEFIRRSSVTKYGASRGEFGWVLEDNGPMRSVGEAINGHINKVYTIYEKML